MPSTFLSVAQAVKLTGKSQPTISRFCRKFAESSHIQKNGSAYLIEEDFLLAHFPASESQNTTNQEYSGNSLELMSHIKEENEFLRAQLDKLQDRFREINHLIAFKGLPQHTEENDTVLPKPKYFVEKVMYVVTAILLILLVTLILVKF